MKKLHLLLLAMAALASLNAHGLNQKRPWLFFVYVAADNNLWPEADKNIAQMVKASRTMNAYIAVCFNIKRGSQAKQTQYLLIQDGAIQQQGATTVEDSGDPRTLIKALSWAVTNYPSEHVVVDLWNHGSGSLNRVMRKQRGVCYDDSTGHFLTDIDYKNALDTIVTHYLHGRKIDIVCFDACLMADIEVAFTLQHYADFAVSSQQTVPGPGYNYTDVINTLAHVSPSALDFAKAMVQSYERYYQNSGQSYTLSAVDLSKLPTTVAATNTLATLLNALLKNDGQKKIANGISAAAHNKNIPVFAEPTYMDLYEFCSNLYIQAGHYGLSHGDEQKLKTVARNCMASITHAVVANTHSRDLLNAKGLSIYFASTKYGIEPSYYDLYWTTQNPAWLNFLGSYLSKVS